MGIQHKRHPWFIPEWLVGAKALGYKLEKFLGAGGFGAVYLTTTLQGEARAVKVLYPPHSRTIEDLCNWQSCASRFLRELLTTAQCNHRNIVRIYDTGMFQWRYEAPEGLSALGGDYLLPFYVADYIPGGVDQRLMNAQALTSDEIVEIARQVLDGLTVLHSLHPAVLHLDLNPANIRLAEGPRAVITDFGVARIQGVGPMDATEATELPAIHPGVAAPEQYTWEEPDGRTDIYQFGALCFKMLTGKFPRELAERFPSSNEVLTELDRKGVPDALANTVSRCLEIRREDRFPDVGSLRATLPSTSPSAYARLVSSLAQIFGGGRGRRNRPRPAVRQQPLGWRTLIPVLFGVALALGAIRAGALIFPPPPDPIKITMVSSSDKKEWTNQAVATFNGDSRTDQQLQFQGRPIEVKVLLEEVDPGVWDHYRSGTMTTDVLARKIQPTIMSPAERSWILNLKENWPGSRSITSDEGSDLLRSPLVITMWRSRAEALGFWPAANQDSTWERLRALASSTNGWAMVGRPEWGKLKYGYAYVGQSNSATFTQVLNGMSGLQKRTGLTLDDVRADNGFGKAMADLEKADIRIAQKSEWLLRWMRERGPTYLDAVTAYEQGVIQLNREWGPALPEPIVAVYPQDGTILATHPFSILDGAPWVAPEQAKAAEIFLRFLLSRPQQSLLPRYGLRPLDDALSLGSLFDRTYGANPQANLVLVEVPSSQVISSVVRLWEATRVGK
ncbi:MAG: substrate-binding domain-containing protein [Chloroflexi bacterium]|nr:substrate-binding domain-containing protein [Chloroflexota bacterium]